MKTERRTNNYATPELELEFFFYVTMTSLLSSLFYVNFSKATMLMPTDLDLIPCEDFHIQLVLHSTRID